MSPQFEYVNHAEINQSDSFIILHHAVINQSDALIILLYNTCIS